MKKERVICFINNCAYVVALVSLLGLNIVGYYCRYKYGCSNIASNICGITCLICAFPAIFGLVLSIEVHFYSKKDSDK